MSEIVERYQLKVAPEDVVKRYWEEHVVQAKNDLSAFEDTVDPNTKDYEIRSTLSFKRSYTELMEEAVHLEQYKKCSDTYEKVTRLIRIRIDLARPLIEQYFKLRTISLYGIGLYTPLEGLILSESFRVSSKYDESLIPLKGSPAFDISAIPKDIQDEYEFRLAIPAMQGLFVPKKSRMTQDWIGTAKQLEYLDIMLG